MIILAAYNFINFVPSYVSKVDVGVSHGKSGEVRGEVDQVVIGGVGEVVGRFVYLDQ